MTKPGLDPTKAKRKGSEGHAPHIRSCSKVHACAASTAAQHCVTHRGRRKSPDGHSPTMHSDSRDRRWKSHQPKQAAGHGGGSGVSIGVVVAAAGGIGRLSCAPARCQMCTDLARPRFCAQARLEQRGSRSRRPRSRSSETAAGRTGKWSSWLSHRSRSSK